MIGIFESLERRFNADTAMVAAGRKLYLGLGGQRQKAMPYWEVNINAKDSEFDTFDDDVETFTLDFEVLAPDAGLGKLVARNLQEFQRVFKRADLISEQFRTVSMKITDMNGPHLEEGIYVGRATCELITQRKVLIPTTQEA